MKNSMRIFALVAALALISSPALAQRSRGGSGKSKSSGTMNVQVRSSTVRATPNYLGASAGTVSYGQQVKIVEEQGNWYRIEKPSGWLPKADVTKSKVAVDPDQKFAGRGGSHDEVALAGKGFNPQVEQKFKGDNPNLQRAFSDVNKVEAMKVPEAGIKSFMRAGKLTPR
ncbi:MAG TPA: SH3 domain-containing protein [bacterium]|nr:SH3 domain-containing protein [bacterium]